MPRKKSQRGTNSGRSSLRESTPTVISAAESSAAESSVAESSVAALDRPRVRRQMARLRDWFRSSGRDLPWRRTRDPYHVLVSELMLQQTQVSRVIEYYERWLKRFPTLHHVAKARPGTVREAWEGLGYYARVRNLQRLARQVAPDGQPNSALPPEPALLRKLPGVGAYTAGAVASFAYERRASLVDTNVARVLLRLYAPSLNPKSGEGQRVAWALAEAVLPRNGKTAWTHNQALMELGALVCTARVARCEQCPLRRTCPSRGCTGAQPPR